MTQTSADQAAATPKPTAAGRHPSLIGSCLWFFSGLAAYVLSIGPMDQLVANDHLPTGVLYYQRPLYALADRSKTLDRFLHWYVSGLWKVDEALLR